MLGLALGTEAMEHSTVQQKIQPQAFVENSMIKILQKKTRLMGKVG